MSEQPESGKIGSSLLGMDTSAFNMSVSAMMASVSEWQKYELLIGKAQALMSVFVFLAWVALAKWLGVRLDGWIEQGAAFTAAALPLLLLAAPIRIYRVGYPIPEHITAQLDESKDIPSIAADMTSLMVKENSSTLAWYKSLLGFCFLLEAWLLGHLIIGLI